MSRYERLIEKIKIYIPIYVGSLIFSGVIYALLMTEQLVNSYDGLWEYSYHTAKGWELSLGRWFWLYIDQLRLGISIDPLTSIISLSIFSLGIVFLLDLFDIAKEKTAYAISFLFLSNTVICISLSYRFMSPTFGIAFLLSILSAWVMMKAEKYWVGVSVGAVLLAFAVGAYQAYIGCTCIALLGYLLYALLHEDKTLKEVLMLTNRCVVSGIFGGALYIIVLKLHLKVFHVSMSGYNGANIYSFQNTIIKLFDSVKRTYEAFEQYFLDTFFLSNVFQKYKIFLVFFVITGLILCCALVSIWKRSKLRGVMFAGMILLIPIACGAVLLVATEVSLSMQMTAGWGLCIPVLLCVVSKVKGSARFLKVIKGIVMLFVGLILYGNIYQVTLDQNAMMEGKIATTTMASDIVNKLGDKECLEVDLEYCILGLPVGNPLFSVSNIYNDANTYAKFGVWWLEPSCTRQSWYGVFHYLCGIDLNISSATMYNEILANEEIRNMPSYPEEGFIYRKDNVVVIKVADY